MADMILVDGDKVYFLSNFGPAVVVVKPGNLQASGCATLNKKKVCVNGDEATVSVPGCIYMTPQYSIPGTGTLKIAALASDQTSKKTRSRGKPVLLKGGNFIAKFEVQSPAKQPPAGTAPPIPDATPRYTGSGMFVTINAKLRGT
jgi:Contractile injection system spike tip protein